MSRKSEKLFDGITEIDADLIEETLDQTPQRRARPWMRAAALAACVALIIGAGYGILSSFRMGTAAPGDGGGAGHDEGSTFMHYAGPVFPLTTAENANGITAERDITLDFAAYGAENYADGITVTDTYTLTNTTDADITLTAAYPTAGTLLENPEVELSADGEVIAADFVPGAPLESMFAESWADYAADLGGAYLADALSGAPELDETVTVYALTDITGGDTDATAPTLCMSFALEGFSSSRLLTWGFNGGGLDREHGIVQVSFFIPEEDWWGYGMTRYVIVRGEDIGEYAIQGYADGGCDPGEEIDGVSASVRHYETTLGEILDVVAHEYYARQSDTGLTLPSAVTEELFAGELRRAVALWLDRTGIGSLNEICSDVRSFNRVFYRTFSLTIPAGEIVTVTASFTQGASYDFYCSGSGNIGVHGYDLMTQLGSTLSFSRQSAEIVNTDGVEIVRQNFGLDPDGGTTRVELDLTQERYYLEVRRAGS